MKFIELRKEEIKKKLFSPKKKIYSDTWKKAEVEKKKKPLKLKDDKKEDFNDTKSQLSSVYSDKLS